MPATLDTPVLPPYLYRYRKINDLTIAQEIAAIRERYLWRSTYKDMNDPMEGFYEPTSQFQKSTSLSRAIDAIYDEKSNIGICCLSDTCENELMWSYYTENYGGICVGYAPQELINGMPNGSHLVRVAYGNKPPDINATDGSCPNRAAIKILSHKKASWVHEREWRVLSTIGRVDIKSNKCSREVRLASNMKNDLRDQLRTALIGLPIRVYSMEPVSAYSHTWKQIQDVKGNPLS